MKQKEKKKSQGIPNRMFSFPYRTRIGADASCTFLKFYTKFPFGSYTIIYILEFKKKKKKMHETSSLFVSIEKGKRVLASLFFFFFCLFSYLYIDFLEFFFFLDRFLSFSDKIPQAKLL